ncbi:hypothetical protein [Latilactobacillus graminis]|nr:hypothetical protein [Latilactobacillus graminis]QFP79358.1 hypothetical protein LG542_03560 [Latilactobacillus graminis]
MGSRIMHYAIASILEKKYGFDNNFLIGSIAPDINKNSKTPKELTHFMKVRSDGEHDMFPEDFIKEYGNSIDSFKQGYYLHLISDNIWLNMIYKKYVLNNSNDEKRIALEKFYKDFHYFNQRIITQYNLKPLKISHTVISHINEINDDDLPLIIKDLNLDFTDFSTQKSPYLLSIEDIDRYINTCVHSFDAILEKIK